MIGSSAVRPIVSMRNGVQKRFGSFHAYIHRQRNPLDGAKIVSSPAEQQQCPHQLRKYGVMAKNAATPSVSTTPTVSSTPKPAASSFTEPAVWGTHNPTTTPQNGTVSVGTVAGVGAFGAVFFTAFSAIAMGGMHTPRVRTPNGQETPGIMKRAMKMWKGESA